ncbi:GLUG domain protein [Methanolobus psychrophilus R15]|nr:GLUG domain protein [Methanolobus psychrophilus R15]
MRLNINQFINKKPLHVSYVKYPLILLLSLTLLISTASATPVFEGDGSSDNPYQISNISQLQAVAHDLSANYTLINDIDASETENWNSESGIFKGFKPIGNNSVKFTGTFDGQNYTITGLFIDRTTEDYVGLFGRTDAGATIKDVGLVDINITGENNVGGLVGENTGTIENSYSTGNVTGDISVGGLVGHNLGTIENSYSTGNVTGDNIDASETENWNSESGIFKGFKPIGNNSVKFTGTFDGQNYTITGLFIDRTTEDYVGLFGRTDAGATIKDVGLVDINITGGDNVGGLVGENYGGTITDSHSTGDVTGENYVGGLVGYNDGAITDSYSTGDVTGTGDDVGGLVGLNTGTIENSYSTSNVTGTGDNVGGLVGINYCGTITNSHSTGDVTGENYVGGLVGYNADDKSSGGGTITDSYSIGEVNGTNWVGGLLGLNYLGTITQSYWDSETSSQSESAGGEGRTTSQMKQQSTFIDWDFTHKWEIHCAVNNGYPYLQNLTTSYPIFENGDGSENNPYEVSTICQLQAMNLDLSAHYILINDIDASETVNWNDGAGFIPIANAYFGEEMEDMEDMFSGSFDGNEYHVNDLFINVPSEDIVGVGLFGYLGPNSVIKNVRVHGNVTGGLGGVGILAGLNLGTIINSHSSGHVDGGLLIGGLSGYNGGIIENSISSASVEGGLGIGGLVGFNIGTIAESFSSGDVIGVAGVGGLVGIVGTDVLIGANNGTIAESFSSGDVIGIDDVGGLVGVEASGTTIINSYSTSNVTGNESVGGLVGVISEQSSITNSYSIGEVIGDLGDSNVGGLIGFYYSGTITESYWNTETSFQSESAGGEGRTTSQMKQQSTFIGWNFTNIWNIHPEINNGYPYLQIRYDSDTVVEDDDVPKSSGGSRQQNIADSKSPSENIDTLFSNRQNVGVGSKVEYHVTADDIPVTLISFDSKTNAGIVENRINLLNNVPEGTPSNNAPVYKFMEINVGRTGTIGSHNADNIFIYFKVDKKWVEENNIIPESIRMERLNNGGWERLPTEQLDEDEEFFYFVAQTSGFSIFSIAGDEWTVVEEPDMVESVEVQPIDIVEDENKSNWYMIVGVLIVTIVAIGFAIYKRKDSGLK